MRALPILLVSVAILLTCEPSHIRPVKTGETNDPVQACSIELPLIAEFRGTDFAWIVPSSGDLLYTRDGGEKWNKITADTVGGFYLPSFIDENTGWVISWSGKLWRTENGGETWVSIIDQSNPNAPTIVSAADFKFIDKLHEWILGPFLVWRTMDGGNTWQPYAPPNQVYYHFYSLFFLDSDEGWIAGDHGTVYHTENSGGTWEEVELGSEEMECYVILFVSKNIGWIMGSEEKLYRTLDGGRSWKPFSYPIPGEGWHIDSVRFLNRNQGWAVGWGPDNNVYENKGGIVLHTADGGVSWKEVDIKHSESFYELVNFSDSQNGWILSRRNVYRTVDGGKTWSNVLQLPQSRTEK